jgi:hypothetical protein
MVLREMMHPIGSCMGLMRNAEATMYIWQLTSLVVYTEIKSTYLLSSFMFCSSQVPVQVFSGRLSPTSRAHKIITAQKRLFQLSDSLPVQYQPSVSLTSLLIRATSSEVIFDDLSHKHRISFET